MIRKKVIVAMSGGVDSSVAALLLKQQGYHVEGLFMKNWEEDDATGYCHATQDLQDVENVCKLLNIQVHTVNFAAEYWDNVFLNFLSEYQAGRTPNPDILCNKEIKFKLFLEYANHLGADFIATGHYATKIIISNNCYQLAKSTDLNKDQSYFLYTLNQSQLHATLFPLAKLTKQHIRTIAKEAGFINHNKKDSTGICFIGERRFKYFLQRFLDNKPGPIVTTKGSIIGQHDGLMFYTIGQRQGLGIGGMHQAANEPWYVVRKNISNNELIVAQGHDNPFLYSQELIANNLHWIAGSPPSNNFKCYAKTRYRQIEQACNVTMGFFNKNCHVIFTQPQRAITEGQSIVFYNHGVCLGGGIIDKVKPTNGTHDTNE